MSSILKIVLVQILFELAYTEWTDSNIISWSGVGMKIFPEGEPTQNTVCPTPVNPANELDNPCIFQSDNIYYGPFKASADQKIAFEFKVQCEETALVTVKYNVGFCGVSKTSNSRVYLDRGSLTESLSKQYFNNDEELGTPFTDTGLETESECEEWRSISVETSDIGPIAANTLHTIEIDDKVKISGGSEQFVMYGLSFECIDSALAPAPTEGISPDGPVYSDGSDGFCFSGFSDDKYAGHYFVPDDEYTSLSYEGERVLIKDDSNGKCYLYNNGEKWVIMSAEYDTFEEEDKGEWQFQCTDASNPDHFTEMTQCQLVSSSYMITEVTITNGVCEDHWNYGNIFGISEQTKLILMLVFLSWFSCVLGMVTLNGYQRIAQWKAKKKSYAKVSDIDDDTDFEV